MKIQLVGSTEGIRDRGGALKYCQDFARVCYSEKVLVMLKMSHISQI